LSVNSCAVPVGKPVPALPVFYAQRVGAAAAGLVTALRLRRLSPMSAGPSGGALALAPEEEAVLAVCRANEQARVDLRVACSSWLVTAALSLQGLSQDALAAAMPSMLLARLTECLNTLLIKARPAGVRLGGVTCSHHPSALQGKIQLFSAAAVGGAVTATPVFKFVKPEDAVKCALTQPSLDSLLLTHPPPDWRAGSRDSATRRCSSFS